VCFLCCLLHADFLLGLLVNPEDRDSILLWNVGWLSAVYAVLYPRRYLIPMFFVHMVHCVTSSVTALLWGRVTHGFHEVKTLTVQGNWAETACTKLLLTRGCRVEKCSTDKRMKNAAAWCQVFHGSWQLLSCSVNYRPYPDRVESSFCLKMLIRKTSLELQWWQFKMGSRGTILKCI
jgi:hypothetical protein